MTAKNTQRSSIDATNEGSPRLSLRRETVRLLAVRSGLKTGDSGDTSDTAKTGTNCGNSGCGHTGMCPGSNIHE